MPDETAAMDARQLPPVPEKSGEHPGKGNDSVYLAHFQLGSRPFGISPDPRFLYVSSHHRDAMAHLLYTLRDGSGFALLTGEVGTGKTTLSRWLLSQATQDMELAFILNPRLTPQELLASLCDELGIPHAGDQAGMKSLLDALTRRLLANQEQGRQTVLLIDEAQDLAPELLEQVRLLTNLENETRKLLQIILIGQPELRLTLARPELRQLSQRITARYHLPHLDREETAAYVCHRLAVAGRSAPLFTPDALKRIFRETLGIPRLINLVCDRALLGTYARNMAMVTADIVHEAAREVVPPVLGKHGHGRRWGLAAAVVVAVLGTSASVLLLHGGAGSLAPGWIMDTGHNVQTLPPRVSEPEGMVAQASEKERATPGESQDLRSGDADLSNRHPTPASPALPLTESAHAALAVPVSPSLPQPTPETPRPPPPEQQAPGSADVPVPVTMAAGDKDAAGTMAEAALLTAGVEAAPKVDEVPATATSGAMTRVEELKGEETGSEPPHERIRPVVVAVRADGELNQEGQEEMAALISSNALTDDLKEAYADLLRLRGLDVPVKGQNPCAWAEGSRVACYQFRGHLGRLRLLEMPAILPLMAQKGIRYAVVKALRGERATLRLRQGEVELPVWELETYWNGLIHLVWSPPTWPFRLLRPGDSGRDVGRLRSLLGHDSTAQKSNDYDPRLVEEVRAFQRRNLIDDDGIVGPMTLLMLMRKEETSPGPMSALNAAADPAKE